MPPPGEHLLSIGEFSRLSRITIRMLRHYDEHGVLHPTRVHAFSGYRQYAPDLLRAAGRIRDLRDVGLRVDELAACARVLDDPAALRPVLERQRVRLLTDAATIADRVRGVDRLITELEVPLMPVEITHRTIPARTVASVRDTIPGYQDEGLLWERLMAGLAATGGRVAPSPLTVAVFHDDAFVESGPDVEVQLDVIEPVTETGDVRVLHVPEQQVAVGTLHGGFDGIGSVMEALAQWVDEHGYRYAGPMFNIYVVGPRDERDPALWVTDVCAPVAGLVDDPAARAADATRSADGRGGAR
ncbi:MAG TPA: MerR family transcriptional regulator [Cellulomonas sp.]|uniref:MerR family transcriptional regulator n=1 Tax=Cellulomonas sp. TaxID=40001 RepID=UPI002E32143B|nr:MerR family transcriptional regulator [Cellulomonas sp.]HEX5332888.1 MerR family transcriptional regulator [Cellulomonas sp.]